VRTQTTQLLSSPVSDAGLKVEAFETSGDDIIAGRLVDADGAWYRIEDGIADLAPPEYRNPDRYRAFCAKYGIAADGVPAPLCEPDANALKQIEFFANFSERYEAEVVRSPFYDALDRVTIDPWIARNVGKEISVLEVGCGSGRETLKLARSGARVLAVDLSEDMLRMARQRLSTHGHSGRVDFVVGSAENLPVGGALFDAAILIGSLHHFSDPYAAMLRVSRALRRHGRLYVLEPHASPLRFLFDWAMKGWKLWHEQANDDPLFEKSQLSRWLQAGGFKYSIRYSTFLPPHLWYLVNRPAGDLLLSVTDRVFGAVPGIRTFGGVIIAEAVKES